MPYGLGGLQSSIVSDLAKADSAEPGNEPDKRETAARVARAPDKKIEELDVGWGEHPREADRLSEEDERLLRERPPHWE
jgi:hypothetical protein